jgi:hypothetical protein
MERLPISDAEFKERRAHPAYKPNLTCERVVSGGFELARAARVHSRELPDLWSGPHS